MSEWSNRLIGYGLVDADQLLANPANWRRHPNVQREALRGSLDDLGWIAPVIVNQTTGFMIDGHARAEEALARGAQVPVAYVELSPAEEAEALAILDPIGAMATADADSLDALLREITTGSEAIQKLLAGIAEGAGLYLDRPLAEDPGADLDHADELREKWGTEAGQLWEFGKHRLLCGDSTQAADVTRLMAGERASLMPTDPPYLVDYDGGNHPQSYDAQGVKRAEGESTKHWDDYTDHESAVGFYRDYLACALAHALAERPVIYQWFGMMRMDVVLEAWRANGLLPHQVIIWHKSRPVLARCDFMWDYEPCMYGWVKGQRPEPGVRPPANARAVWDVDQREGIEEGAGQNHPTMKPVEVIRRPIEWHTTPGELIYEPFSGSGTALVAAEMTGRRCYALELSPQYVAVALERLQGMGLEPRLLDD